MDEDEGTITAIDEFFHGVSTGWTATVVLCGVARTTLKPHGFKGVGYRGLELVGDPTLFMTRVFAKTTTLFHSARRQGDVS